MTSTSSDVKSLFEIKSFEGNGFDLWKERMLGILFLKDCEGALAKVKPEDMTDAAWMNLNKKAITYIKMAVSNEILVDLKGLTTAFEVWEKLKATYENTTLVNQVHLMRKLDSGLLPFDDKLKAIFLLMTLPDSWETLVVSLSNSPSLTFDGVRGSILNEEIRRKASGEGSGSANRKRSKSKGKAEVTCYQCGRKGHKKPDCRYYKAELERKKNTGDKKKKDTKNEAHDTSKDKDKEKANVASSVIIEELSDAEDILCASFHVTPIKECFTTFHAGSHGHVYLGNNHACSIEGIGTVHLTVDGTNELVLHDVRYVRSIKKSLLFVGQMDMHGYSTLFEKGSWKLIKGSRLIVRL
ncbi:hypothetical protein KP509_31G025000 [Ceratopteris richardii]|uniref:CCHC-type domain-containing protein n=1 Tax=Ceratopteris richardii TaxID=49495 RepID=A0A8T2QXQ5_CERRI|nr:hypothetical protein KP509_31G025000 [Ceratopteris richardii]